MHYNNDFAIFNRVYNLAIAKTDWQTLTGIFTDVFQTKIFKETTGHTIEKPLGRNQGNLQTAGDTMAVCNIMLYTERIGNALDEALFPFYLFSNKVKYVQVSWWVSHRTFNCAINE